MNARDLPSRVRTFLICIVGPINTTGSAMAALFGDTHPLKKKLAVDVLDGIETEAGSACGLARCPSTDQGVG
jgi:hypothetical protein